MFGKNKNQYLVFDPKRLEFTVHSNKIKNFEYYEHLKKSPNVEYKCFYVKISFYKTNS
jgi:hypothetical protein